MKHNPKFLKGLCICSGILTGSLFSTAVLAATQPLIRDLPPQITTLIAKKELLNTLAKSQRELTNLWLADKTVPNATIEKLRTINAVSHHYAKHSFIFSPKSTQTRLSPPAFHVKQVAVSNLHALSNNVRELQLILRNSGCDEITIVPNPNKKLALERHNFLVFFVKNFQKLCPPNTSWKPTGIDYANEDLFSVFDFKKAIYDEKQVWVRLHKYFSIPSHYPFMQKNNIMTAIYFYYLRLTFDARVLTLAMSEFLARRRDLYETYPELGVLRGQLAAGLVLKLWN